MSRLARRVRISLLGAVLFTAGGIGGVAQAAAPSISCGAVLTVSAVLTHDLACPNGDGLTLGQGVTLDLAGHILTGPGSSGTAVSLSPQGGSSVTNGTIRNWSLGIDEFSDDFYPAPTSKISGVTFSTAPLNLSLSTLSVTKSTLINSPIFDFQSRLAFSGVTFSKSDVNGFYSQIMITSSKVIGGSVKDGGGFAVTIDRSTMDGAGYTGSPSTCSETSLTITNSTVRNYRLPVIGFYCAVTMKNNLFHDMPGGALGDVSEGFLPGEVFTSVSGNTFVRSGIAVSSGAMNVSGNAFLGNTTGVLAQDPQYTTVSGNILSNNTNSGIRAVGNGLILKNNVAVRNGQYGIYAPVAVNRGGNVAFGNKSGQCVGLTCRAK